MLAVQLAAPLLAAWRPIALDKGQAIVATVLWSLLLTVCALAICLPLILKQAAPRTVLLVFGGLLVATTLHTCVALTLKNQRPEDLLGRERLQDQLWRGLTQGTMVTFPERPENPAAASQEIGMRRIGVELLIDTWILMWPLTILAALGMAFSFAEHPL